MSNKATKPSIDSNLQSNPSGVENENSFETKTGEIKALLMIQMIERTAVSQDKREVTELLIIRDKEIQYTYCKAFEALIGCLIII